MKVFTLIIPQNDFFFQQPIRFGCYVRIGNISKAKPRVLMAIFCNLI